MAGLAVNDTLENILIEVVVVESRYCPENLPGETEGIHKNLSQDCWCASRHSNRVPPEYKYEATPVNKPGLLRL
jgi:hypothetical protein